MNKYEIEVKEILKKKIIINAERPKDALDLIEKIYLTSNILEFKPEEIEEVEAKILEENGIEIGNLEELNEEEFEENELEDEENLLDDYSIEDLEEILEKVKEKIARNDKNSVKFENKINNILKEYNELMELVME